MAVSEPERGSFDPKAHLHSSLDTLDFDGKSFGLAPQQEISNPTQDFSHSINVTAHKANGNVNSAHEAAAPLTNGINGDDHTNSAQPSFDLSSAPESVDTGLTQDNLPSSSTQTAPDDIAPPAITKSDESPVDPAPPVIQQPTSDVREEVHSAPQRLDLEMDMGQETAENPSVNNLEPNNESLPLPGSDTAPAPETTSTVLPSSIDESKPIDATPAAEFEQTTPASNPATAAEGPLDPAPTPVVAESTSETVPKSQPTLPDEEMQDVPASPSKVSRPREDDEATDAPAAKRTKTDSDASEPDFKVPERPPIDSEANAMTSETTTPTTPMTKPQQRHIQRAIGNVKRIGAAKPFLAPVDTVLLNIPNYFDFVKTPMDLKTLEENLRADKYNTVEEVVADFNLMVSNTTKFNGEAHPITKLATDMKANFEKHMASLPSADVKDIAPSKKKAPDPMAIRAPPARRESRSSLPASAQSPGSATSPQIFAPGPDGVPLIRRGSTIDGRPKREIHRPAPRDLPYAHQKPKKKKYQWELKFCDYVLKEVVKPKYKDYSYPFMTPVDAVALNIPTYHNVVKKPMDFGTVREKLDRGEYENAKEFETDARQIFKNCYLFNPEGDSVNLLGKRFESIFNDEWGKKNEWLDENAPSSGQRSPASSDEEDSEEEEEEDEEDEGQLEIVSNLQKQIAEMSKQVEMITSRAKKKQTPPAPSKKSSKPAKATKKETKKAAPVQSKSEKKAAPKPAAKKDKSPYVTYEQKQDISTRINSLPEAKMTQALAIIRNNMPNLKGVQEDELELDIDELSNDVLYKLLLFVRKHVPRPDDSPARGPAASSSAAPARKKNKPMSKHEQEARIAQVQSGLSAFQNKGAAAGSDDVHQSIENNEPSDDEEDSESEEE